MLGSKHRGGLLIAGVEHETEISFFRLEDYLEFKKDPEEKW